ncbi:MAG: flagellar biosynthesis protein FliQ [Armatimonadetes bacterium]|uniref:Flagellar biosynthetic protein FliQ n=1 Tax=Candidatus Nitrosymbiomonas proteolyticus TaxID=2608984 RepID=A0A809S5E7_9BACT|nr:MAG: flagellar biosynthetic protein FliQ [Armatimonadota bacterium]KXK14247.1 MAG: flagellar biosynthetic protein FliQ [Armatimonadetes bacterium OLB18]MCK6631775.1 flagellar biosynthesis protein FliQ [Fimbriimonadaceae bacterium]QOJ12317.1 MAG: flagellar biosynthesis protein FliQ [Chthonomonadaceae bacterium]BBO24197.1 flagellar biosynthetic protein FliQ [Candidatus Nitrosymbiomonas proteolyticus]
MDSKSALDLAQHGVQVALMVALPGLAVTLFIGLAVSIFQAITQVHEMTLTFVPKVLGIAVVMAFFGHWMLQQLVAYMLLCFDHVSRVAQ